MLSNETEAVITPVEAADASGWFFKHKQIPGVAPINPGPAHGFRPEVSIDPMRLTFGFLNGGMGDYLCWLPALRYVAKTKPWVYGTVVAPTFFHELLQQFFGAPTAEFPHWDIMSYEEFDRRVNAQDPFVDIPAKGPFFKETIAVNATGSHLLDCGFAYFAGECPPPAEWNYMPVLDPLTLTAYRPSSFKLKPKTYAVITPQAIQAPRRVRGEAWRPILTYLKARGLTPVLLGQRETVLDKGRRLTSSTDGEVPLEGVEDWRDRTSLMQAASIMKNAAAVIGLDNGLLHLAAYTDVPIVYGYNVAAPWHREPRRRKGVHEAVTLTKEELGCIHCQSNTHMIIGFDFGKHCYMKDLKCLDLLFSDNCERWTAAIGRALSAQDVERYVREWDPQN